MKNKFTIDVDNSINSGQVFLWQKSEENWYGIDGQNILKINQSGKIKSISNRKTDFFRKNDDIQSIIKSISKDKTALKIEKKIREYPHEYLWQHRRFKSTLGKNFYK